MKIAVHCAGLVLIHPSRASIEMHRTMESYQAQSWGSNQQIFNHVVGLMGSTLRVGELNPSQFRDSWLYFEEFEFDPARCCSFVFDSCCPREETVVLHATTGKPKPMGKIYKFKEHLLWAIDDNRFGKIITSRYICIQTVPMPCCVNSVRWAAEFQET